MTAQRKFDLGREGEIHRSETHVGRIVYLYFRILLHVSDIGVIYLPVEVHVQPFRKRGNEAQSYIQVLICRYIVGAVQCTAVIVVRKNDLTHEIAAVTVVYAKKHHVKKRIIQADIVSVLRFQERITAFERIIG